VADIVALRRRVDKPERYPVRVVESPALEAPAAAETRPPRDLTGLLRQTGLAGLVRPATGADPEPAPGNIGRILPVLPGLRRLLPGGGLRRGSTIAVAAGDRGTAGPSARAAVAGHAAAVASGSAAAGGAAASLMLALLAEASAAGSWCAIVGAPWLGAVAAAEAGIELSRLALVPHPGPDWTTVVAALLDGLDVVVAVPPAGPVAAAVTGRLAARARQRGSVLMPFGRWDGADLVLSTSSGAWQGLGAGHGRLRCREVTVSTRGRGAASQPRQARVWLPGPAGTAPATPVGTPASLPPLRAVGL
jgi:hypothetical protein